MMKPSAAVLELWQQALEYLKANNLRLFLTQQASLREAIYASLEEQGEKVDGDNIVAYLRSIHEVKQEEVVTFLSQHADQAKRYRALAEYLIELQVSEQEQIIEKLVPHALSASDQEELNDDLTFFIYKKQEEHAGLLQRRVAVLGMTVVSFLIPEEGSESETMQTLNKEEKDVIHGCISQMRLSNNQALAEEATVKLISLNLNSFILRHRNFYRCSTFPSFNTLSRDKANALEDMLAKIEALHEQGELSISILRETFEYYKQHKTLTRRKNPILDALCAGLFGKRKPVQTIADLERLEGKAGLVIAPGAA